MPGVTRTRSLAAGPDHETSRMTRDAEGRPVPVLHLTCPHCRSVFAASNAPGTQLNCPSCQAPLLVPGKSEAAAWYVARNRQRVGPFTWSQLQQLAATGQLRPADR